jgi:hypothetical protein
MAQSLRISTPELRSRMRESFLAREVLTMSNLRLVISIAQKYDKLGVELADLIQVMTFSVQVFMQISMIVSGIALVSVCFTWTTNVFQKD